MSKFSSIALCALLSLPLATTSAVAASKSDPRPVTKDFNIDGFGWNPAGDLIYLWAPFNNNGQLEICGLYSTSGPSLAARASDKAMSTARIMLGKKSQLGNLKYFKFVPNQGRKNAHMGELANCKVTKNPFPADPSQLTVKFKGGTVRVDK